MWLVGVFFELYVFEIWNAVSGISMPWFHMISLRLCPGGSFSIPWIFQGARVSDDPRERDLQISCEPGRCVGSQNLREMIGRCDIFWSRCQLVGLLSSLLVMFFSVFSSIFCSMKGLLTRSLLRITNHQHQPLLSRWLKLESATGASTGNFQNIQNATNWCCRGANHSRWIENLLQLGWAVQGSIQPHPCENSLPFKARFNAWLGVVCVIELFWCPPVSFYFLSKHILMITFSWSVINVTTESCLQLHQ